MDEGREGRVEKDIEGGVQGRTEEEEVRLSPVRHGRGRGQCGHFATHQHLCLPTPRVTHLTWAWPAGGSDGRTYGLRR